MGAAGAHQPLPEPHLPLRDGQWYQYVFTTLFSEVWFRFFFYILAWFLGSATSDIRAAGQAWGLTHFSNNTANIQGNWMPALGQIGAHQWGYQAVSPQGTWLPGEAAFVAVVYNGANYQYSKAS